MKPTPEELKLEELSLIEACKGNPEKLKQVRLNIRWNRAEYGRLTKQIQKEAKKGRRK